MATLADQERPHEGCGFSRGLRAVAYNLRDLVLPSCTDAVGSGSLTTPEPPSLEDLIVGYRNGDAAAFNQFFARTRALVYAYLRKRLAKAEAADDVFQDTYFRVHRYVTSFDPDGSGIAWLLRIAHNSLSDHLRRQRVAMEIPTGSLPDVAGPSTEDALVLRDLLESAALRLSKDEVSLIVERFRDGISFEAIAAERAWTPANARQRLSRAVRKLKAGLG